MKKNKRYLATEKRYVTEEEYNAYHAKKKLCKNGREHDWHDSLPRGITHPNPTPLIIEAYYTLAEGFEEKRRLLESQFYQEIEGMGLKTQYRPWNGAPRGRRQLCHRCSKVKGW